MRRGSSRRCVSSGALNNFEHCEWKVEVFPPLPRRRLRAPTPAASAASAHLPGLPPPPPTSPASRRLRPPPWPPPTPPTPPASPASRRLRLPLPGLPPSQSLAVAGGGQNPHKRRAGGKGKPGHSKKLKRSDEPVHRSSKPSDKFLKLLRKRARDYNSDDDEPLSEEEEEVSCSEDESAIGFARFEEGCKAFRVAFSKVMAKNLPDDPLVPFPLINHHHLSPLMHTTDPNSLTRLPSATVLGPILSAHKKLVVAKLAEDAGNHKPRLFNVVSP
ncbi:hypothetical protein GUJ93_ZPchr0014g47159 [Zizania palustris]|uniref:Uncharacterized protein n=1 Tax=Zizania palustris TaxID=103762 RepID=A0A8J5W5L5_ZIZPA|nr:hypothetical protein GUJ93_ZPchr0014g47159 [Zizania palustris]